MENWRRKCKNLGIEVEGDCLYTLLFADDQVVIAADEEDINYWVRKLFEEYEQNRILESGRTYGRSNP